MRKGYAIEGFINEDGTIRALKSYDDTEVRGLIADNASAIASLELSKADKNEILESNDEGYASVYAGAGVVTITVENHQEVTGGEVDITPDNIGNLYRALEDPEAPVEDGDALITNGQVHAALAGLDSIRAVHKNSSGVIVDTASVITGWDGVDNHAYIQLQLTHAPLSPKNAFITPANINNLKAALDGFADGVVQDSAMLVSSGAVFEAIAAATTLISKTYYDDGETTDEAINLDEDYVCANKQMYKVAITGTQGVDVENLFCTDDAADTITIFGNTTTIAAGKTAFIDAYKVNGGYILHVTGVYDTSSAVTAGGATQSQGE